jgi:hypothetical protein
VETEGRPDVESGQTRAGVDRRTLIKRAAAAGAVAWTAPVIIDSISSEALAATASCAVTVTALTSATDNSKTTSVTTGSFATTSKSVVLIAVASTGDTKAIKSITGPFTSATLVENPAKSGNVTLEVWKATGDGSSSAATITFNAAPASTTISISQGGACVTGVGTSSSKSGDNKSSPSVTLSGASTSGEFFAAGLDVATTVTQPGGFTELHDISANSADSKSPVTLETSWSTSVAATATATPATKGNWSAAGLELT